MRRNALLALVAAVALVLTGCDWTQYLAGPDHTGATADTTVRHDDVAALELVQAWNGGGGVWGASSPVVSNGRVFITTGGQDPELEAFDGAGVACPGFPAWCQPTWTAPTGIASVAPAVAGGLVFAGWMDPLTGPELATFDAAGQKGCAGTPRVCTPRWTTSTGGYLNAGQAPTVAGGLLFMGINSLGGASVAAFDAAGVTNCAGEPKRCTPLWQADVGGTSVVGSPTVAGGALYVETGTGLQVFDAAGVSGCTGTPTRCAPLWTSPVGSTTPVVANGSVYLTTGDGVAAVDAAGVDSCTGAPRTCSPLWTASTTGRTSGPAAVASGRVFVASTIRHPDDPGADTSDLQAFDAAGSASCDGTPRTCAALWTARLPGGTTGSSPSVADGVVYIGTQTWLVKSGALSAFDAAGEIGCSGTPRTCEPMTLGWTYGIAGSNAAIANGFVYVVGSFNGLIAFTLDHEPPTVSIVYPPSGTTVSGTTRILVAASDDKAVRRVDLEVTGQGVAPFGLSTLSTYYGRLATWDTLNLPDGDYVVTAYAADYTARVETMSTPITVTVANGSA